MQYDHTGRITFTRNKVNSGNWVVLSRAYYNEIGQLKNKRLHSEDGGSSYLEDLQFMYNERGWLRASGSANSGVFNLELKYNKPSAGPLPQFNGNISQMNYHYAGISPTVAATDRSFGYAYDDLNRLTNASLSTGTDLNEQLTYDELGNITALTRGGQTYSALGYTYTNGLLTAVGATAGTGFTPRSYAYDRNGNATTGGTLETKLAYNMLNLPATVKNSANTTIMTYTYDATGQKLRTVSTADGTREYISGINYVAGAITTIQTGEGRLFNSGGTYTYQYDLKDHLGNTRVTIDKQPSTGAVRILQEDEYYAFGLLKGRYDYDNGNRYLYNGKEIQKDLTDQYDYGARFYDPVIGRWTSVDPLAEKSRRWSPYTYGKNNPIVMIDPDGMFDVNIIGDKADEATKQLQQSTSLKLSRDKETGKLSATGEAKTPADEKLLQAITDKNTVVNVNATSSNYTEDGKWFVGGAFGGSTVSNGITTATQTVNPKHTKEIDEFYGAAKGSSVMHEVLEAFIGAKESPGSGAPIWGASSQENTNYQNAHDKANVIDPRHVNPQVVMDGNTGQLYITKPHPIVPELPIDKLINDRKKK